MSKKEKPQTFDELKYQVRSEEVQEILSFVPNWMTRWGITLIFVVVIIGFFLAWLIKYPDVVQSQIIVTTLNPPARIIAQTSGKLGHLEVNDQEYVEQNQLLGVLESPTDFKSVHKLKSKLNIYLDSLSRGRDVPHIEMPVNLVLGELQNGYSAFQQSKQDYHYYVETNYIPQQIASIKAQIELYKNLNQKSKQKKSILSNEFKLAQKKIAIDSILFEKGVISDVALYESKSIYLQKKSSLENTDIELINNSLRLREYEKSVMDLEQQDYKQIRDLELAMLTQCKNLLSQIGLWEKQYVFYAPVKGKVSFFQYWSLNQYVTGGEELMTIVPDSTELVGKIFMEGMGAGKVEPGQKVRIKFDGYKYEEFGAVEGKVKSVSDIKRENKILVNVELPNGLNTNFNKSLTFKQEMSGSVEIITKDQRLLERIFDQIISMFEKI